MLFVLPIRDENRTPPQSLIPLPIVTYGLLAANIFIFFKMAFMDEKAVLHLMNTYGLIPYDLFEVLASPFGRIPRKLLPLVTSMFLHGSWMHLIGNMLFLYIYGDNVECRLGHFRYLAFYLVAGIVAALSHVIPFHHSAMPMVGASGAISGVLGAYLIMFPQARIIMLVWFIFIIRLIRVPAFIVLGFWFLGQVMASFAPSTEAYSNVAWHAHVGGFIFGMAYVLISGRKQKRRS